ncbi:hypothetical protein BDQ12DRAFT_444100 [Crucibulum laeve]|uniref:Uncharacterized protein n=1 Tax=Crucibulum laeve TaxID=68775 RepID=A0A5C3LWX4_9AGAR|nr:hypothetical protein BDQ12DRAFT_444100 [Crucibulum laeve]
MLRIALGEIGEIVTAHAKSYKNGGENGSDERRREGYRLDLERRRMLALGDSLCPIMITRPFGSDLTLKIRELFTGAPRALYCLLRPHFFFPSLQAWEVRL